MKKLRTLTLAIELYRHCQKLKAHRVVKDQLIRAALSIPLNVSEGSAKPTSKDRRKFYFIALGSLRELQTLLEIQNESSLMKQADVLGAHLYRLCHAT